MGARGCAGKNHRNPWAKIEFSRSDRELDYVGTHQLNIREREAARNFGKHQLADSDRIDDSLHGAGRDLV